MAEKENSPGPIPGAGSAVASGTPGQPNPPLAPSPSAKTTVAKHGGLRGGKARADGLVPGSAEAAQADREKDAERKRAERAERAAVVAASQPLPSKLDGLESAVAAPAGNPAPGVGPVDRPRIPWTSEILRPLTNQTVKVAGAIYVSRKGKRAVKANLPVPLIKEVRTDAEQVWKEVQTLFEIALPQFCAKWLNKTGLSAENSPEFAMVMAFSALAYHDTKSEKKIQEYSDKVRELEAKAAEKNARAAGTVGTGAAEGKAQ